MWEGAGQDGHLRQREFQCKGRGEVKLMHGVEWKQILVLPRPELLSIGHYWQARHSY